MGIACLTASLRDCRYTFPVPIPAKHEFLPSELDAKVRSMRFSFHKIAQTLNNESPPAVMQDGFVHFSTAKQLPATLNRFFADAPVVTILKCDYGRLSAWKVVKWEAVEGGESESFAPLRGPAFPFEQGSSLSPQRPHWSNTESLSLDFGNSLPSPLCTTRRRKRRVPQRPRERRRSNVLGPGARKGSPGRLASGLKVNKVRTLCCMNDFAAVVIHDLHRYAGESQGPLQNEDLPYGFSLRRLASR